jgi:hypothetical protein
VTVTSIVTGSDGKQSTSVSASSTAVGVPVQNNSSGGGLSGKTWGIIGGVVGVSASVLDETRNYLGGQLLTRV